MIRDFYKYLEEEHLKEKRKSELVLDKVKSLVSEDYYSAVLEFLKDPENGIWGELELVKKPLGNWQEEDEPETYWETLSGMYVNQHCGMSGDDYHGTLTIKISEELFLQTSFNL